MVKVKKLKKIFKKTKDRKLIKAVFSGDEILSNSKEARDLYSQSLFGEYIVYKDLRNRGYLLKTALKFGADFRVYDKGQRPGKEHARWILYPISENAELTWQDFSAKNRVAHSTKKNLLVAVVDSEGDITYY